MGCFQPADYTLIPWRGKIRDQGEGAEQLEAEMKEGVRVVAGIFMQDMAGRVAACPAFLAGRTQHVSPTGE
jgi:hypothetical protein